jgi:hypothetical protein
MIRGSHSRDYGEFYLLGCNVVQSFLPASRWFIASTLKI